MKMKVIPEADDRYWEAVNLRNTFIGQYEALARSAIQTVFEVAAFKQQHEGLHGTKVTNQELEELWNRKVVNTGSELQEKVNQNWLENAMKVYDRLLVKPHLYQMVHEMQELYGKASCFNHVEAMSAIVTKAKVESELVWVLNYMKDMVLNGMCSNKDFLSKLKCMTYLLDTWLPEKGCQPSGLKLLRELTSSIAMFRQRCGGGTEHVDISWQGTLLEYERKVIDMLQAISFCIHDHNPTKHDIS
jgi:hypothetical protein